MSYIPPNIIALLQKGTPISLTGTTVQTTLDSIVIPGGYMGLAGWLQIDTMWSNNNSVNNKTLTVTAGATNISAAVATSTNVANNKRILWANQGVANSQKFFLSTNITGLGNSNSAPTSAIDTSLDFTLAFKGTLANAGDTMTLEAYSVVLIRNLYP